VDRVGECRRKNDVLTGLGEDSVGVIERGHGSSRIRQRQGASVGWNLKVERTGQGGSRVGVDVVVRSSELDGAPAVL
jgi:hypothetical protein